MKDKWTQVSEQWKRFSVDAKKKWDQLTDEELAKINGSQKDFASLLQKRYGLSKKVADKQVMAWVNSLKV